MTRAALTVVTATALAASLSAQASPGFRMYGPHGENTTYLVDNTGTIVHTWPGDFVPGNGMYLLPDGSLVRSGQEPGGPAIGGKGGNVQRRAFDGTLLWDFKWSDDDVWHHHDIELMPNGNVLLVSWDRMTEQEAIDAGRDPALIGGGVWLPDAIVEVQPDGATGGIVVWEWHMMDHVIQDVDPTKANFGVVEDHPELLDINYPPTFTGNGDWNHVNSISYYPTQDIILVNAPFQDEFYLIDHSTTTAEAAGHTGGNFGQGGDLLYRWGNPAAYRAGTTADQQLFNQHGTYIIPDDLPGGGNVLIFNNQAGSPMGQDYSTVIELELPASFALAPGAAYGPAAPIWEYSAPVQTDLYSSGLSNVERMPNGNTQVVSGRQGWMFEITTGGTIVWEYFPTILPPFLIFQASYYERYLWADRETISAAAGGSVDFDMVAGSDRAGDLYLLLGSVSGTSPGFDYLGENIPLNFDFYTQLTIQLAGGANFPGTFGVLDGLGNGSAGAVYPAAALTALVGTTIHHSYASLDAGDLSATRVGNAVPLEVQP